MTLWIHVLEGREYAKDSDDYTLMHKHAESLDAICEEVGVRKLSEFFDFTDLEYSYADVGDDSDEEPPVDPETGLGYGIDDMTWFKAAEGRSSMQVLRERIAMGSVPELSSTQRKDLLEELDDCIALLEGPASRSARFHLAVIE